MLFASGAMRLCSDHLASSSSPGSGHCGVVPGLTQGLLQGACPQSSRDTREFGGHCAPAGAELHKPGGDLQLLCRVLRKRSRSCCYWEVAANQCASILARNEGEVVKSKATETTHSAT